LIFLGEVIGQPTAANETRYANALMQSYPNPSNPMTAIRFSLREPGHASLKIYDVAGALVRTLVDERVVAGLHSILWDGRSNSGEPVSSGVYFYKLTSKTFVSSKKMVLVK
jgi:flagellar hook assembly protein FlgD